VSVVNSTGTINPVLSISVGSFVSGPIKELHVDFNQKVKKGQLMALIDPKLFKASVDRDEANVANAEANVVSADAQLSTRVFDVDRVSALLEQAENDEQRAVMVRKENMKYISATEMDQFKFNRKSLKAQLDLAKAAVKQAEAGVTAAKKSYDSAVANLEFSKANLGYTEIRAPEDGIIINRKIDPGQTLAAQFTTPEMFIVGIEMEKHMHIIGTVDEADIGLILKAQDRDLPVRFTVDAYPDELFSGKIFQVRQNATTTQNVVTYPVVVEAQNKALPNGQLMLRPGMTASLSFQTEETKETLRIPNAALRFYPQLQQVRPEDRHLLDNAQPEPKEEQDATQTKRSAMDVAESRQKRNHRHVWVVEGRFLRAVEVVTGISDHKFTQLVSGELTDKQMLVTGAQP
jgi:HlyD family secretion protein